MKTEKIDYALELLERLLDDINTPKYIVLAYELKETLEELKKE